MELLWNDDPEELLLELGFGCDEPDLSGRIPARFINYQSQARGINLQVFLEAQKSRIDLENPTVSNRFRQLEVLQEVSVAFSALAGTIKGPKDMSPEARERRRKMAMLFRRASKKSLSQLHGPMPEELTVDTALHPSAGMPKPLEPMYGPEERKVPFRRVKLQDTVSLSPFVEEEGDGTEAEVQDGTNTSTAQSPEGEPRAGTLRERYLDRVLQRKKSLQMRESFEMEELGSFDEGSAAGQDSAGTHFARGLIRVNSCQSDSSGFLEDPLIPTLPQDASPATDLIKALSALSGGSTDSHSSDISPLSSAASPNHTTEHLTGTPLNHLQIPNAASDCGVSSQSREQTPQENGILSPYNDLSSPETLAREQNETKAESISSDNENLRRGIGMEEKTVYFVSQKVDDCSKTFNLADFDGFPIPLLQTSVSSKEVYHSAVKKKPTVVTHFLSHQGSIEDLNTNNEEALQHNQDVKKVENIVNNLNVSKLQSEAAYLETEIDWQDSNHDFEEGQSKNSLKDCPVFTHFLRCQDSVKDLHTNDEETLQRNQDIKEKESARSNLDGSGLQSEGVCLEAEIDWLDETQHFEHHQRQDSPGVSAKDLKINKETLQGVKEVESVVSKPEGSTIQSNDAYLETEIDWQDATQDFEGRGIEDFSKGQNSEDYPVFSRKDSIKNFKTNEKGTYEHNQNVMKIKTLVTNLDDLRVQSDDAYLETEIDWQNVTQGLKGSVSDDANEGRSVFTGFAAHQCPNTNNYESLQRNQTAMEVETIVSNPNISRQPSEGSYLETEIDWQDVTKDLEDSRVVIPKSQTATEDYPGSEKLIPKVSELIEIESLGDVFETSVDASDVDAGDVEAFFQEIHSIGRAYWAEPIHIGDLSPQSDSFEDLGGFQEGCELEIESDEDVLPSTGRATFENERTFKNSMDFHNCNIHNKTSVSLTDLEDKSKCSVSVQILSNSSSHIVHRKDVPFMDNPKHNILPRHVKLDTSNPFRAVQSWTNLHIQYNSNVMARKVSKSMGGNLNAPAESYWSPYQEMAHEWQSDDCLHRTSREEGFPSVSLDTGLWADDEDEEVDRVMGRSGQNGKTWCTCDWTCNCCRQGNQHTLSQRELEGLLLYLQQFRSVLRVMEEQLTEEQAAVYSALTQHDRQCLEELLRLRQAVRQEALELELQLSDLVHHQDHSLTMNMLRLLDEQSLLCSQLRLSSPGLLSPLLSPESGLANKRTVATQCSPQQGSPCNFQAPSPPQLHSVSYHQGLGCAPTKTDKRHLVGFLHKFRDSIRH